MLGVLTKKQGSVRVPLISQLASAAGIANMWCSRFKSKCPCAPRCRAQAASPAPAPAGEETRALWVTPVQAHGV